jgi:hypothetical protein
MRSISRGFLAAILLTAAAGFALSQEASAPPPPPPPPPAPDVAAPVAALPQLPVVAVEPVPDPNAPAVNPALTVDPSILTVAPAAAAIAQVPEPEKPVVTTTTKRVTKKTATKPVAKPVVEAAGSFQSVPAPAAAGVADPSTFQGSTPPGAAATSALPKSIAPAAPAAKSVTVENQPQQTIPQKKLGIGSWILGTILVLALIVTAIRFMREQKRSPTSIVDFTDIHPELKAAPVHRS